MLVFRLMSDRAQTDFASLMIDAASLSLGACLGIYSVSRLAVVRHKFPSAMANTASPVSNPLAQIVKPLRRAQMKGE